MSGGLIEDFSDEAILRALLDALESADVGCSIVLSRPALHVVYANASYARMAGLDPANAKRDPFELLPGEEVTRIRALVARVKRGEVDLPKTIATKFVHADGTEVPVEVGFGYARIGEQLATFSFFRDTTEKTAMEAALRASEDRFRTVAEASPDAIAIYVDRRCVYANPKALALYETDERGLAAFDPVSVVPDAQKDEARSYEHRIQDDPVPPPFAYRRTMRSGETRDVEASLSATTIGGEQAILVFTRDITERQRLQAELLKQDRLASLGVLAAGVAHELNNPLAALSLLVRRLRGAAERNVPSGDLAQELEQADDAVKRMSAIIGDLLFLARPGEHPHAHVDLEKVLASSIALLRAGVHDCAPIVEEIGPLPAIHGFPSKLGQAVVNVLRNALQAVAGRDAGEVRVRARADAGEVRVTVEDNGPGIPDDVLPKLTTPFYTTKEGGTGLGLWITQGIMQTHGGRLELESKPGVGTKVTLVLPA